MANQPKKYTKFVAAAATATLVASAIVPVASAAGFSDVADTNSHAVNINALAEAGIIGGYQDGTFKPNQELTRGQVVKMLGKWVEKQGFEIPADYASKARFTDLAADAKDQELVKYAALVFDTGVFAGSNGALNAGGKITRENMALVLDRAFKAINDTTLVEVAAEIEDVKVADLATAKAEAREAIQALRNLGISGVENFMPKDSVTRAQFATFLNKTINTEAVVELTVKEAVAVDANTVEVTLSDDTKHTVKLEKALEANKATEIKFTINEKEFTAEVTYILTVKEAKVVNASNLIVTLSDDTKHEVALTTPLEANKATAVKFVIDGVEYTATVTYIVTDLAVASLEVVAQSQIVVKFNKAIDKSSVVDTNGDLKANVIKIDGVALTSSDYVAEFDKEGTVLTLTSNTEITEGVHKFEFVSNAVATKAGEVLKSYEESFRVTEDKTRAEVAKVESTSKFVYEITFSEPVTAATATFAYANKEVAKDNAAIVAGQSLSSNGKVLTVTFDNATLVNEDINVSFAALTDVAGNVSSPITKTVKISDADKVRPTVSSVKAISATQIEVKFSEAVTAVDGTKFNYNGTTLSAGDVVQSTKDKSVVTLTVGSTVTSASLVVAADAVEDLSGNKNREFSQVVYFNADKTAPTFVSSKVQKIGSDNVLVLTMSEKVTKQLAADLVFKYVDAYGVTKSITVPAENVEVNADDATKVEVILADNQGTPVALPVDTDYTVEFAAASFKDLFKNESAKFAVKFNNKPVAIASNKLELAAVTPVAEGAKADRLTEGTFVDVTFNNAVEVASAKNKANYAVEGATVSSVELIENDPSTSTAKVRVFIEANTIEATGNYNVTVAGVKGFNSNVTVMDTVVNNIEFKENVAPTLVSATVLNATDVKLTFSETVELNGDANDFEFFVDGKKVTATVTAGTPTEEVVVTVAGQDILALLADGKKVELRAASTIDLADVNGNVTNFKTITLK